MRQVTAVNIDTVDTVIVYDFVLIELVAARSKTQRDRLCDLLILLAYIGLLVRPFYVVEQICMKNTQHWGYTAVIIL